MLRITILFDVDQQQWTHEFQVSKSSTIMQLKERMLGPGSVQDDLHAFELQRNGSRVHDAEQIVTDQPLCFEYLGQEEGARRAAKDRACSPPEPFRPKVEDVQVTVRHATDPAKGEISVVVKSTGTVGDVRRAVMSELGEARLSEVKLVQSSLAALGDDEKIGSRREFLSTGRALKATPDPEPVAPTNIEPPAEPAAPSPPPAASSPPPARVPTGNFTVTVTIDRALGFQTTVEVSGGDTVRVVKEKLAETDPTGTTTADSFSLGISPPEGSDAKASPLPDSTVLTEAHMCLDTTEIGV
mmetsp:Transcript_76796/g.225455  ORF Transcript_76796/g.225455 Transcript_76796/m.225455 type:complete len:299 (-) Transcript_76796:26-922(-)